MRFDKLTTKFQQALRRAEQALGKDSGFIEPQPPRCRAARAGGCGTASLLSRAGVAVPKLKQCARQGHRQAAEGEGTGGEIGVSRDLTNLLNLTDREATKRGDQFIASELFCSRWPTTKARPGGSSRTHGLTRKALESAIEAVRGGAGIESQEAEGQRKHSRNTRSTSPSEPAWASSTR